jgi:hypothetical protein
MRWKGYEKRMGKMRKAYNIFVGKTQGKRPPGKPRRRWEDSDRMYLMEILWEGVDWIHLAQDRDRWRPLVNTVRNFWVP